MCAKSFFTWEFATLTDDKERKEETSDISGFPPYDSVEVQESEVMIMKESPSVMPS